MIDVSLFKQGGKKFIETLDVADPARNWIQFRNILRQGFNYSIILFCKPLPPCEIKNNLYRLIGVQIGKNVSIAPDCILDPIYPELIRLDDDVVLGWGSKIYTHEYLRDKARFGSVHFKKGSLLGEWSVVRPGIEVGENALVGAMSFVNKDVPKDHKEGGVPIHLL